MGKRKLDYSLAGLSKPLNTIAVWFQLFSLATLVLAYQPIFMAWKMPLLLVGIPIFVLSMLTLIVFRGGGLYTMYFRFLIGTGLLILSCVHIVNWVDLKNFINSCYFSTSVPMQMETSLGFSMGLSKVHEHVPFFSALIVILEFIVGIQFLIGGKIRWFALLILPVLLLLFFPFVFGADWMYLKATDTWNFFSAFARISPPTVSLSASILLVSIYWTTWSVIFGFRIHPNTVKTNWYMIPFVTMVVAVIGFLMADYASLMIIPLAILFALYIYRIGGRFIGSHWTVAIVTALVPIFLIAFQSSLFQPSPKVSIQSKSGIHKKR